MNKDWLLTKEAFDELLNWLDSDRDQAGLKYEEIRRRLIMIFTGRGCCESEDLADETINRVSKRLSDIKPGFSGDPARYFYGVANKVYMESLRKKPPRIEPLAFNQLDGLENEYRCLEQCIENLQAENRTLVLEYYQEEKGAKIERRKLLAQKLGIALNALRIRAYRIRNSLEECVNQCLKESPVEISYSNAKISAGNASRE